MISKGYRWRLAAVGIFCSGFAAWSAYDGFIKYPAQNEISDKFEQFKKDHETWPTEWKAYAEENGLPVNDKEAGRRREFGDILTQYLMLAITLPIGLVFLYGFLSTRGRWVECDDDSIRTSWGQSVSYDKIQTINKGRWDSKGIAIVSFEAGKGEQKLIIDDWKYERALADEILREIESHISRDQIVGGEPEPKPESAADEPDEPAESTADESDTASESERHTS